MPSRSRSVNEPEPESEPEDNPGSGAGAFTGLDPRDHGDHSSGGRRTYRPSGVRR
jgi:hypothetical protein